VSIGVSSNTDPTTLDGLLHRPFGLRIIERDSPLVELSLLMAQGSTLPALTTLF
jgi:hypothetical protein